MNSNGSTLIPDRGLPALGLLMDFLQVNQNQAYFEKIGICRFMSHVNKKTTALNLIN